MSTILLGIMMGLTAIIVYAIVVLVDHHKHNRTVEPPLFCVSLLMTGFICSIGVSLVAETIVWNAGEPVLYSRLEPGAGDECENGMPSAEYYEILGVSDNMKVTSVYYSDVDTLCIETRYKKLGFLKSTKEKVLLIPLDCAHNAEDKEDKT